MFADHLKQGKIAVTRCKDYDKLLHFLHEVDKEFPTPLSTRTVVSDYVSKILSLGNAFVIEGEHGICAGALFYCNDRNIKTGYLSLLAVVPGSRRKGYASALLEAMEKEALQNGMERMELSTDISNTAAVSLYSGRGYEVIKTDQKIRMRKDLLK